MRITSKTAFLGLPLFELAMGEPGRGPHLKGPARAWIAVGDLAISPFLAVGGLAIGTVALGGVAVGGVALGGTALGTLALGGCAVGGWALGGLALGLEAAKGGLAASWGYAQGGAAFGPQANSLLARLWFLQAPAWLMPLDRAYLLAWPLTLLPFLGGRRAEDRGIAPR